MNKQQEAPRLLVRANALEKRGDWQAAFELYERAARLAPRWSMPFYNLGLVCKNQKRWQESLEFNRKATKLDPKCEAGWWNMGIAATALGDWERARAAWRGFGIKIPAGSGPLNFPCGCTPIRLNPDTQPEVVWADRIDPARACIVNIPFPESGHRWQDIVLNDGAPVGHRQYQGKQVPVFNAIELLQASAFGTFLAEAAVPEDHALLAKLTEMATERECCAEDWNTSVRFLCKACSEGRIHDTHDTEVKPVKGDHLIGIAATELANAKEILSEWQATNSAIVVHSVTTALEPAGTPPNVE